MSTVGSFEARTRLSRLLEQAARREEITRTSRPHLPGAVYPTDARPDHQSSGERRRRLTRCARPASVVRGNEAGIIQLQE